MVAISSELTGARARWRQLQRRALARAAPGALSIRLRLVLVACGALTPLTLWALLMEATDLSLAGVPPYSPAWLLGMGAPLALAAVAVAIVAISADALTLRWLTYLERLTDAFGHGRYGVRPKGLEEAPVEFHTLGAAIADMAAAVEHRDRDLRAALEEKTALLREVHHRVKNNLQIMGSLVGMQAARVSDPETRLALTDVLVRLDALSLAQRQMDEPGATVGAVPVLQTLAGQVGQRLRAERPLTLVAGGDDTAVSGQTASTLLLIAGEAALSAVRRSGEAPLQLTLDCRTDGADLLLRMDVLAAEPAADRPPEPDLSVDMIARYARALNGKVEVSDHCIAVRARPRAAPAPVPFKVSAAA